MPYSDRSILTRDQLAHAMAGGPLPRLMCPPLTHYTAEGAIDRERMRSHWAFMTPHVKLFLVPGTTGDGWELSAAESHALLDLALELAGRFNVRLLVGVLAAEAAAMRRRIEELLELLGEGTGLAGPVETMKACRICAFAVCPPRGANLPPEAILSGLTGVLEVGAPTALYQLPQVTGNEISPAVFAGLAQRHMNLILLKDSSGTDRIAQEDRGRSGVALVRGAEGHYARWLREGGGPYDGWLLSAANCFPGPLRALVDLLERGEKKDAEELSARLSGVMLRALDLAGRLPAGNAYANANKAMDHFMAHGPEAGRIPPPRLHAGMRLPEELLGEIKTLLENAGLMPEKGYLEQ